MPWGDKQAGGAFPGPMVDEMDELVFRCSLPSRVWLMRYLLMRALRDDTIMAELHELDLHAEAAEATGAGSIGRPANPVAYWQRSITARRETMAGVDGVVGPDAEDIGEGESMADLRAERDRLSQEVMDLKGVVAGLLDASGHQVKALSAMSKANRHGNVAAAMTIEALRRRIGIGPEVTR